MSPAELKGTSPEDVSFAVPVDSRRRFNPTYIMEVFRYVLLGPLSKESTLLEQVGDSRFRASVDGTNVFFKEKRYHLRRRAFKYRGNFIHEDLDYRLIELEPVSIKALDQLYLRSRIVLIGCDPSAHYQGWTELADLRGVTLRLLGEFCAEVFHGS